jgi:hypothetical protein
MFNVTIGNDITMVATDKAVNRIKEIIEYIGTDISKYNYPSNANLIDEITSRIAVDYLLKNYKNHIPDNNGKIVNLTIGDKKMVLMVSNITGVDESVNGVEYGQILGDEIYKS